MQVRRLEEAIGEPLVEVTGHGLRLTHAGEVLMSYARRIMQLEHEAESALNDLLELRRGVVTIGASTIPGAYVLPKVLAGFRSNYPQVELRIQIANSHKIAQWVLTGEVDCGIVGSDAALSELESEVLCTDKVVVIAPPDHPLLSAQPVSTSDLASMPFVLREPGSNTRETFIHRLNADGVQLQSVWEVGSNEAVKEAVASGAGLGVISQRAVTWEASLGRVRELVVSGLDLQRSFCIVRHRQRRASVAVRQLLATLRDAVDY